MLWDLQSELISFVIMGPKLPGATALIELLGLGSLGGSPLASIGLPKLAREGWERESMFL